VHPEVVWSVAQAAQPAVSPTARRVKNQALPCSPGAWRAYFMHGTPGEDTGPTNTEAVEIVGRVPSRGALSRIQAQYEISGLVPSSPRRLGSLRNSRQGCLRDQDNPVTDNLLMHRRRGHAKPGGGIRFRRAGLARLLRRFRSIACPGLENGGRACGGRIPAGEAAWHASRARGPRREPH